MKNYHSKQLKLIINNVGSICKKWRESNKLSLTDVSRLVDINITTLSKFENGTIKAFYILYAYELIGAKDVIDNYLFGDKNGEKINIDNDKIETMLEPFTPFDLTHIIGKNIHRYEISVHGTDLDYEIEKESFELLKPYANKVYEERI